MTLVNTLTQSLRTRYSSVYDKNERRRSVYGGLELFQRQTAGPRSIITPEIQATVARSMGNSVVIPVLDAQDVTIGNVRSCTVADSENESNLVTLTFATLAFGFTMYPMQHYNNDIDRYQIDFDVKMEKYLLKLAAHMDSLCIDKLNTDKNQVWATEVSNVYATTGNALQVPRSESDDMYNQLSAMMQYMDFYSSEYDILANTMHQTIVNRVRNQGAGNDTNDAFQFGPYSYGYSNRVANRSGVHSTLYALNPGSVAILNRNDPDALSGRKLKNGKEFGLARLPIVNMDFGTYYMEDCTDASALHAGTGHLTRTVKESFEFSTDIVLMSAYNSDPATRYNPIIKAEVWAGDSVPV